MAVSYVTGAVGSANPTTSFTVTIPTVAVGDLLILEFTHRGTGNGSVSDNDSGGNAWVRKGGGLYGSSLFSSHVYWKRATAGTSAKTITVTGLTNSSAAVLTVYRGILSSGEPLSAIASEQNASGDESHAAITTLVDGSMVVLTVSNSPDLAIASQSSTSPGALTERQEHLSTGGTDASISHASAEKTTAGATGALTWAQTNAASGSMAYYIIPAPPPAMEQHTFRFRNDDGTETTATWKAAANVDVSMVDGTTFRLRVGFRETNGVDPVGVNYLLQYSRNGGGYTLMANAGAFAGYATATGVSDGQATTQQVTSGSFTAGMIFSDDTFGHLVNLPASGLSEFEFVVNLNGNSVGDTLDFQVIDATYGYTYTEIPRVTIAASATAVTGRTSQSSYGAVTPTPGAVSVTVAGRTSTSSFGTVTPQLAGQTVAVSGRTSSSSFGTVTAAPGGITQAVSGRTSVSSFGTVTAVGGATTIAVSGRTSTSSFGAVTAVPGAITQAVSGRTSVSSFGTVTAVGGATTIAVSGRTSASSFGTVAAVGGATTIAVAGRTSASSFGAVGITTGGVVVAVSGRTSASSFGTVTPSAGAGATGVVGRISLSSFGAITPIGGPTTIAVSGRTSASSFGTVTPSAGAAIVTVAGRTSASSFGTPTIAVGGTTVAVSGRSSQSSYGLVTATTPGESAEGGRLLRDVGV